MISRGGPGTGDPGRITWTNNAMRGILLRAFGIRAYQLSAPKWVETERFDITARVPSGATQEQFRAMLRNLLTERFQMRAHEEMRDGQVLVLTVGKGGPKLQESHQPPASDPSPVPNGNFPVKDGFPVLPPGPAMVEMFRDNNLRLTAQAQTMKQLAEHLASQLDREVMDQTGLPGLYDFHLSYQPEGEAAALPSEAAGKADTLPDVFAALAQQLGLRLDSRKGRIRTVVIDSLAKIPKEN